MSRTPERDQIFHEGEREALVDVEAWLVHERAQAVIAARIRERNRTLAVKLGGVTPAGYVFPDMGIFALCGIVLRADLQDRLRAAETLYAQLKQRETA